MKYLLSYLFLWALTVLLILFSGCYSVNKDPMLKDVPAYMVDNARWNEKSRWFKYINDSIQDAAFPIRLKVMVGLITPQQGFDSLLKLIDKAHTPFHK